MAELYPEGTEIIVLDGIKKGEYGIILAYEPPMHGYSILFEGAEPDEVWVIPVEAVAQLEPEGEGDTDEQDFEPPGFGMTEDEFVAHLEFLITRSLSKVPTVGPKESFFGYQEFEGLHVEDVLLRLLDKIEEGIAHLAQAHILISRIGVATRTIMKEITDAQDDE